MLWPKWVRNHNTYSSGSWSLVCQPLPQLRQWREKFILRPVAFRHPMVSTGEARISISATQLNFCTITEYSAFSKWEMPVSEVLKWPSMEATGTINSSEVPSPPMTAAAPQNPSVLQQSLVRAITKTSFPMVCYPAFMQHKLIATQEEIP